VSLYHGYLDKLAQFSQWLLDQGYTLRVFSTEMSVDRYALEDLRARLLSRLSPELVRDIFRTPSESVKDVLNEISGFDYVVTSKFHGIIFSHMLRKPVIAISYHRKMDVAMRGQEKFCTSVEHFDVPWLKNAFQSLVHEGANIQLRSAVAVESYAAKLSQQFDGLFLTETGTAAAVPVPLES
jgi:polysaccharide pyruvyl transferase WcaK-like protein